MLIYKIGLKSQETPKNGIIDFSLLRVSTVRVRLGLGLGLKVVALHMDSMDSMYFKPPPQVI